MLQLNACLLLFIITTDKTLASFHHRCHEHIDLSQEPTGHIGLTPEEVSHTPKTGFMVCRRTLEIPAGHAVLLKLVWLEGGSDMSLHCVLGEKARALELGNTALLSGCDQNKAMLTWSGAGHSSNAFQLFYNVQEDERNTTEASASPRSDHSIITQSAFAAKDPHFSERVDLDSSRPSTHDPGLMRPATPLPGTGSTDREALLFPEEGLNNEADMPGAPHHTDSPGTQDYFHTQHSTSTHSAFRTSQIANTQTVSELSTDGVIYQASRTLEVGENTDLDSSSIIPVSFLGIGSTELPHNASMSGTMDKKMQDSTKNWQSTSTHVSGSPDSPRTQGYFHTQNSINTKFQTLPNTQSISEPTKSTSSRTFLSTDRDFHTTSSTLELREKLLFSSRRTTLTDLEIGSTEIPHITTKSGITDNKTQDSTWSQESASTQVSGQTTAMTFDTLNSSSAPTQESITTADTDRMPLSSSLGTPSASLGRTVGPRITESELATTQTSITTDFFTLQSFTLRSVSDSTFGETSKEEAKTEGTQRNVLTTISYFSDQTIDNERTTSFTTKPRSTVLLGDVVLDDRGTTADLETVHPTEKSAISFSTDSPSTTSLPQTFRTHYESTVVNDEIFPTSESYRRTTAVNKKAMSTTMLPASQIPYQGQSSKYESVSSPTVTHTGQREVEKRGTTARGSHQTLLWTQEPASSTNTFTQPHKYLSSATIQSSTVHHKPKFYIVPDEPAIIRVESINLLLQIIVEESRSTLTAGLEEDTALWLEPYLQRAPGFRGLLGVWSSGHAVQCLVEFNTTGALQWLNHTGISSLLEQTGLSRAVREGRSFRSTSISNITLGGLQGEVCGWLLQCRSGFTCVFNPHTSNYSCTSVCHSDYCHHHGLCTHHPAQPPVCRCLAGEDFWFLGQRCDVRMTRARLVVTCLAVLLIVVAVIGVLAFVAVRRYRALLIQAKVDQTRSSYRRFNHFDELSGRFWLRSWAGSADSLDNPAFTRSDELLHLRALEQPCCYHDDTMSLPSTCPSPGMHIRTIYPHSSQYAWRGSDMSMGDGVLDSGKASDLSVCSWPVEPIQWTPFPLLQQLSTQRPPAVRVSRPRSYCEGMELVDMGRSWTA